MRTVLMVHNYYSSSCPSGEGVSFEAEAGMLRARGHEVITYTRSSDEIGDCGFWQKAALARRTIWAEDSYRAVRELIRRHRPEVAHFQNIFPLVSPSAYRACRDERVPVVQSLRNFRLVCPAAQLFREIGVCEECLGKAVAWPGVVHGCYRHSSALTGLVALMLAIHRARGTWSNDVDVYISNSEFAKRKLREGGLAEDRVAVKPNFVDPDPSPGEGKGGYGLFVGRISKEKGIATLIRAWRKLRRPAIRIVGDGPMRAEVEQLAASGGAVQLAGALPLREVTALMRDAQFLIFPPECYETFGRVVAESFACGTPVIASRLGAPADMIEHRRTGLLFDPGDSEGLAAAVDWAMSHPAEWARMRLECRAEFEKKYTAEKNYEALTAIYRRAIERQ